MESSLNEYKELARNKVADALNSNNYDELFTLLGYIKSGEKIEEMDEDELRDKTKILVVKDTRDILTLEATHQYNGLYYVLGGLISPLDGIGPDDLNIDKLEEISKDPAVNEVILATSFTPQGETTALYLERILARENLKITRIAYGLPAGGDIEYADERTIQRALESRK